MSNDIEQRYAEYEAKLEAERLANREVMVLRKRGAIVNEWVLKLSELDSIDNDTVKGLVHGVLKDGKRKRFGEYHAFLIE